MVKIRQMNDPILSKRDFSKHSQDLPEVWAVLLDTLDQCLDLARGVINPGARTRKGAKNDH